MPIRDYSLQLNTAFFKEMKGLLDSQKQNTKEEPVSFCQFLLQKYKDCAAQTQVPEKVCQSEMEIMFLTHCVDILNNENSNHSN